MVGPLKRPTGGFEHICVAVDKFTKWIDYKPLVKFNATKAVEFMRDIMYHFGMPNWIITDLGSPFTAKLGARLRHKHPLRFRRSSPSKRPSQTG